MQAVKNFQKSLSLIKLVIFVYWKLVTKLSLSKKKGFSMEKK